MTNDVIEQLNSIIADPFDGPFEGEDYWIDPDGTIQVPNNVSLAATIMRKVNNTGLFAERLVKIGHRGDNVLLGFDTLKDAEPAYKVSIGYKRSTKAEVKKDANGKFCVYLDGQRNARLFNKLVSAKQFLKQLDATLKQAGEEVAAE